MSTENKSSTPINTTKTKDKTYFKWQPNDPFILHFLLDGYIADNIGNDLKSTTASFKNLLIYGVKDTKAINMARRMRKIKILNFKDDPSLYDSENLDKRLEEDAQKIIPIEKNTIIYGGYSRSKTGHAIGFYFKPEEGLIFMTNSGERPRLHSSKDIFRFATAKGKEPKGDVKKKKEGEFIAIYKTWQLPPPEFDKYTRLIMAAIQHPLIDDINKAYKYQVDIIP